MKSTIQHVPTNIITGFLGTGKTSTIQQLLAHKPANEKWAVLVNEFGTVGIDASLYQNQYEESGGVYVREVPGGCMCCVSGLPMQIALNVLLKLSNPDRLLIEPSGLGHPVEVVSLLMSKYYQEVLDIQTIITLIDPQHFIKDQYFEHETYQQQLTIADTWVFNKTDLVNEQQIKSFKDQLNGFQSPPKRQIYTQYGQIEPGILEGKTGFQVRDMVPVRGSDGVADELPEPTEIPESVGYLKSSRTDEGFHCISWRYLKSHVFNKDALLNWIQSIQAERIKGVFMTDHGVLGFNVLAGQVQIIDFNDCLESKLEIIAQTVNPNWDEALSECLVNQSLSV